MPKYRVSKIKRQHTILPGIDKLLLKLSEFENVKSITPGRIKKATAFFKPILTFSVELENGVKLIGKSGKAVQEVFVVTENKEAVLEFLKSCK
ncbi:hypothetical protein A2335_00910 [Candidatus Peregrinibacteria bacterium RIFOXYB2_FULL_32_7]|nr:MAG: hypothetical protein A2335_00910 [Candidatus Peregrinibacteria bacterium RIFOXYB2_FULL_32_7]